MVGVGVRTVPVIAPRIPASPSLSARTLLPVLAHQAPKIAAHRPESRLRQRGGEDRRIVAASATDNLLSIPVISRTCRSEPYSEDIARGASRPEKV